MADDACGRLVCLPVHSDMTEAEAETVAMAIRKVYLEMKGNL